MAYRIFLSHSNVDAPIAKVVAKVLNDAFRGDIIVYLAIDNVIGGTAWKEELIRRLNSCDAIITILSKDSISKPWIYVEWSPFWISNKQFYILATEDIDANDLIKPMSDRQVVSLNNRESVQNFFRALSDDSGTTNSSYYEALDDFVIKVENSIDEKLDNRFGIYRRHEKRLPAKDSDKAKIAQFFYDRNEMDNFVRVTKAINSDEIVLDFVYSMFRDAKMEHVKELKLSLELAKNMNRASHISSIVLELIQLGNIDSDEIFTIVDLIANRSQDEMIVIARKLVETNQAEARLYRYIINKKISSNAYLRSLAVFMMKNDYEKSDAYRSLVKQIKNNAELKNLSLEIIEHDKYKEECFILSIDSNISRGGGHLDVIFQCLKEVDPDYAIKLLGIKREEFPYNTKLKEFDL
jgi:hypothetical protein